MSIVINGVDMPKGNSTKNLLIYSDGRVFTGHKNDVNYFAKELPERTGKRMDDTIYRQAAIDAFKNALTADREHREYAVGFDGAKKILDGVPSVKPEQAVKDCRNCKHGKYNDHLKTHFCYNPNKCTEWNLWEPKPRPYHEEWISALRTAQPERKRGEWEEIEVIPEAYDIAGVKTWASKMRCDQCGFITFAIEGHFVKYDFCPNCGAKMKDGDKNGA